MLRCFRSLSEISFLRCLHAETLCAKSLPHKAASQLPKFSDAAIDIKGGLRTCPFSPSRESARFSGECFFQWIYVYMCACVFLFAHRFPCQTNKKIKISGQVGSGNVETFSTEKHIVRHMHITDRQRATEVKPSLPFQLCLSWCGGEWWWTTD